MSVLIALYPLLGLLVVVLTTTRVVDYIVKNLSEGEAAVAFVAYGISCILAWPLVLITFILMSLWRKL